MLNHVVQYTRTPAACKRELRVHPDRYRASPDYGANGVELVMNMKRFRHNTKGPATDPVALEP